MKEFLLAVLIVILGVIGFLHIGSALYDVWSPLGDLYWGVFFIFLAITLNASYNPKEKKGGDK